MKFNLRIHQKGHERIIAVCDSGLIGKTFEEGDFFLDLKAYAAFYGTPASEADVLEALKNFTSLNLVGKEAIALAIKAKSMKKSQVLEIGGVQHAQVYKI